MKILNNIFILLTGILLSLPSIGQVTPVRFDQLDSLQKVEKRTVMVFVHTTWCRYCTAMVHTTFANKNVQEKLAGKFYFVSLDAENRDPILFRGFNFKYKPTGTGTGIHELAERLGSVKGQDSYPVICFLNAEFEIIYQRGGFLSATELVTVLKKLE